MKRKCWSVIEMKKKVLL